MTSEMAAKVIGLLRPILWETEAFTDRSLSFSAPKKEFSYKFLESVGRGISNGGRTRVPTLRGLCPRPLDDGDIVEVQRF